MGVDYSVYVGPFLKCRNTKKVSADPEIVDEEMCGPGGGPEVQHPDAKGYDFWIGNKHRKDKDKVRPFGFSPKYDGVQYAEIGDGTIMNEIQEFMEQYEAPIAKLKELYGSENVAVKWGLIHVIH